jgi:hypothetical protein
MEEILVPCKVQLNISGQQDNTCCPPAFLPGCFECGRTAATHDPFISSAFLAA